MSCDGDVAKVDDDDGPQGEPGGVAVAERPAEHS